MTRKPFFRILGFYLKPIKMPEKLCSSFFVPVFELSEGVDLSIKTDSFLSISPARIILCGRKFGRFLLLSVIPFQGNMTVNPLSELCTSPFLKI